MTHAEFLSEPIDRSRIELVEDHELRFWTRALGCSAEHLLDAIEAVGIDTAAVGEHLAMRQHSAPSSLRGQTRADFDRSRASRPARIDRAPSNPVGAPTVAKEFP